MARTPTPPADPSEGSTETTAPRRSRAEIMHDRLGRISKQLRAFAASLDEDEDTDMLDNATKAVALIRSMRHDLVVEHGPLTDEAGVTHGVSDGGGGGGDDPDHVQTLPSDA